MHIKEGYPTEENTQNGKMYTRVYYGTLDEMRDLQARYPIGSSGEQGVVAQETGEAIEGLGGVMIFVDDVVVICRRNVLHAAIPPAVKVILS